VEAPFAFGPLSGRAVATNPPVVTNGALVYGTLGPTVVGLTGQITNLELNDTVKSLASTKIAYASNRDASFLSYQIYVMNADGSGNTKLTNSAAGNFDPTWSPDGAKIAFTSTRDNNSEIYTMNADGTAQTRLTVHGASDSMPSWSPDGTKIAFVSSRNAGFPEIFVMNADGTNVKALTSIALNTWFPSWSPDGSKILFTTSKDGNREIYVMKADGTGQTRLTNNAASDDHAVWSPDGSKIAFMSYRDGTSQIYVMSPDGSQQTRVTNNAYNDYNPAWSPDGTQVTFYSDRAGATQVYTMRADGFNPTKMTSDLKPNTSPAWSPFFAKRVLVGTNAAFPSASGFLFSKQGNIAKSVLVYQTTNAADFSQVLLTSLTGQNNQGSSLLMQIEPLNAAVVLSSMRYWNLDTSGWVSVSPQGFTMTGALVSFSAVDGEVDYVLPFKATSRSAGKPSIKEEGGVRVVRGDFAGVWDRSGKRVVEQGVSELRFDMQTGKLVSVR
jgi:TolB protein